MRSHIERRRKFAAVLPAVNLLAWVILVLYQPIISAAEAEKNCVRRSVTDGEFADAVYGALGYALGGEIADSGESGLARKFIGEGTAGDSLSDWFMLAEFSLGFEDDYAGYLAAAENPSAEEKNELLTEPARRNIVTEILGGEGGDMGGCALDGAGCNELIWTAAAQKICGYDDSAALGALSDCIESDGGTGLRGSEADVTAMSLLVLDGEAAAGAERWLYEHYEPEQMSCETAAWYIIGFAAQGEVFDPPAELRPIDVLMSCRNADGGFSHTAGEESQPLSTAQAALALAAMAQKSAGGELFGGQTAVDIGTQQNLSCDFFDSYDNSRLEKIEPTAAATPEVLALCERASRLGDSEQIARANEISEQCSRKIREVERINGEIRERFYPADSVRFWQYGELCELNKRVKKLGGDRSLVLSADELAKRQKRLRSQLASFTLIAAAAVAFAAVKISAAVRKISARRKVEK